MTQHRPPHVEFLVPAASENRWSDALASLIATDPQPIARLVGVTPDEVRREVPVATAGRKVDRLDLLLLRGGRWVVAIEAKLFADLGTDQLHRYSASFPDVEHQFVLHLAGLPLNLRASPGWNALTWEAVLAAYAASEHPWVQATASAWLQKLPSLVPHVDGSTVWNGVPDTPAGFELALRSRTAWIANRMAEWCTIEHSLEMSSGGGAWVAAMRAPMPGTDHVVIAEVQEGLDAREWRPVGGRPYSERIRGPVVLVGLARFGAATSEGFDWALLQRVFSGRVVDNSGAILDGRPWSMTPANPRHEVDRENWQAIVAAGAPRWLGKGYGMATAKTHRVCAFGARLELPAGSTLAEIDDQLRRLEVLVVEMTRTTLGP